MEHFNNTIIEVLNDKINRSYTADFKQLTEAFSK